MSIKRPSAVACLLGAVAGCTGAISWEPACGCVPAYVQLAEDLALDSNTQFTPGLLTEAVEKRFASLGIPVHLEGVRSLGFMFRENCYRRPEFGVRCTFWLWHHEGTERGIELNVREDGFTRSEQPQFNARYVYESTSR